MFSRLARDLKSQATEAMAIIAPTSDAGHAKKMRQKLNKIHGQSLLRDPVEGTTVYNHPIASYYTKIVSPTTGESMEIPEFFSTTSEEPRRILILGPAGIGKTMLLHYISYSWSTLGMWNEKFQYVFRCKFGKLTNPHWKENYHGKIGNGIDDLTCFIHYSIGSSEITLEDVHNVTSHPERRKRLLLLVDGYDEISHLGHIEDISVLMTTLLEYPYIIMTSRPNFMNPEMKDRFNVFGKNTGLDDYGIKLYSKMHLTKTDDRQRFLMLLEQNHEIKKLCYTPLNMLLLCRLSLTKTLETESISGLYQSIVTYMHKYYLTQSGVGVINIDDSELPTHPIMLFMKELAYKAMMKNDSKIISSDLIKETLAIHARSIKDSLKDTAWAHIQPIEAIHRFGLLKAEECTTLAKNKSDNKLLQMNHEFIHFGFQEWMCAAHLGDLLTSRNKLEARIAIDFILDCGDKDKYLNTMKCLAGLITSTKNDVAIKCFWNTVAFGNGYTITMAAPRKQVKLLITLLSQAIIDSNLCGHIPENITYYVDKIVYDHIAQWEDTLIRNPYPSPAIINYLLESAARADKEGKIRILKILPNLGSKTTYKNLEILRLIDSCLTNEDADIVEAALYAFSVSNIPNAADSIKEFVNKGPIRTQLVAIGLLGKMRCSDAVPLLIEKLKSSNQWVVIAAIKSLEDIGEASKEVISSLKYKLSERSPHRKGIVDEALNSLKAFGYSKDDIIKDIITRISTMPSGNISQFSTYIRTLVNIGEADRLLYHIMIRLANAKTSIEYKAELIQALRNIYSSLSPDNREELENTIISTISDKTIDNFQLRLEFLIEILNTKKIGPRALDLILKVAAINHDTKQEMIKILADMLVRAPTEVEIIKATLITNQKELNKEVYIKALSRFASKCTVEQATAMETYLSSLRVGISFRKRVIEAITDLVISSQIVYASCETIAMLVNFAKNDDFILSFTAINALKRLSGKTPESEFENVYSILSKKVADTISDALPIEALSEFSHTTGYRADEAYAIILSKVNITNHTTQQAVLKALLKLRSHVPAGATAGLIETLTANISNGTAHPTIRCISMNILAELSTNPSESQEFTSSMAAAKKTVLALFSTPYPPENDIILDNITAIRRMLTTPDDIEDIIPLLERRIQNAFSTSMVAPSGGSFSEIIPIRTPKEMEPNTFYKTIEDAITSMCAMANMLPLENEQINIAKKILAREAGPLENTLWRKALANGEDSVHCQVIKMLGYIQTAPSEDMDEQRSILSILHETSTSENWKIRNVSLQSIGLLIHKFPALIAETWPLLIKHASDSNWKVRHTVEKTVIRLATQYLDGIDAHSVENMLASWHTDASATIRDAARIGFTQAHADYFRHSTQDPRNIHPLASAYTRFIKETRGMPEIAEARAHIQAAEEPMDSESLKNLLIAGTKDIVSLRKAAQYIAEHNLSVRINSNSISIYNSVSSLSLSFIQPKAPVSPEASLELDTLRIIISEGEPHSPPYFFLDKDSTYVDYLHNLLEQIHIHHRDTEGTVLNCEEELIPSLVSYRKDDEDRIRPLKKDNWLVTILQPHNGRGRKNNVVVVLFEKKNIFNEIYVEKITLGIESDSLDTTIDHRLMRCMEHTPISSTSLEELFDDNKSYTKYYGSRFTISQTEKRVMLSNLLKHINSSKMDILKAIAHSFDDEDNAQAQTIMMMQWTSYTKHSTTFALTYDNLIGIRVRPYDRQMRADLERVEHDLTAFKEHTNRRLNNLDAIVRGIRDDLGLLEAAEQMNKAFLQSELERLSKKLSEVSAEHKEDVSEIETQLQQTKDIIGNLEHDMHNHHTEMQRLTALIEEQKQKIIDLEQTHLDDSTLTEKTHDSISRHEQELKDLKITVRDHQLALNILRPITTKANELKAMLDDREKDVEHRRQLEAILADPYKRAFYDAFIKQLSAIYLAASVVQTDIVNNDRVGTVGSIGAILCTVGKYVPMVGIGIHIFGSILHALDKIRQNAMVKHFADLARDATVMNTILEQTSLALLSDFKLDKSRLDRPQTLWTKLYNISNGLIQMTGELASGSMNVEVGKAAKSADLMVEAGAKLSELALEHDPALTTSGNNHASMIVALLTTKIYTGRIAGLLTDQYDLKAGILTELVISEYGILRSEVEDLARDVLTTAKGARESKHPAREEKFTDSLAGILWKYKDTIALATQQNLHSELVSHLTDALRIRKVFKYKDQPRGGQQFGINESFEKENSVFLETMDLACDDVMVDFNLKLQAPSPSRARAASTYYLSSQQATQQVAQNAWKEISREVANTTKLKRVAGDNIDSLFEQIRQKRPAILAAISSSQITPANQQKLTTFIDEIVKNDASTLDEYKQNLYLHLRWNLLNIFIDAMVSYAEPSNANELGNILHSLSIPRSGVGVRFFRNILNSIDPTSRKTFIKRIIELVPDIDAIPKMSNSIALTIAQGSVDLDERKLVKNTIASRCSSILSNTPNMGSEIDTATLIRNVREFFVTEKLQLTRTGTKKDEERIYAGLLATMIISKVYSGGDILPLEGVSNAIMLIKFIQAECYTSRAQQTQVYPVRIVYNNPILNHTRISDILQWHHSNGGMTAINALLSEQASLPPQVKAPANLDQPATWKGRVLSSDPDKGVELDRAV